MAVNRLKLTPHEFYKMTPLEYYYAKKDWQAIYSRQRDYAFYSLHPTVMKEAKSPTILWPLPWDRKPKPTRIPTTKDWEKWDKN